MKITNSVIWLNGCCDLWAATSLITMVWIPYKAFLFYFIFYITSHCYILGQAHLRKTLIFVCIISLCRGVVSLPSTSSSSSSSYSSSSSSGLVFSRLFEQINFCGVIVFLIFWDIIINVINYRFLIIRDSWFDPIIIKSR